MKKISLILIGCILIALGPLCVLAGVIYTMMLPNIFESTAVAKITFPDNTTGKYTTAALVALTRQQAVLAESPAIFNPVISKLNLQKEWAHEGERLPREVVYKILKNSVRITADKKAVGLIRFAVRRDNPTEAAHIANALCATFSDQNDGTTVAIAAQPNFRPVSPDLYMNTLILLLMAVVLAGIGVTLIILGIRAIDQPASPSA